MSPELEALCRARFGQRWQTRVARAVCDVVPGADFRRVLRTVQRYAAGDSSPPPLSEAGIRLIAGREGS